MGGTSRKYNIKTKDVTSELVKKYYAETRRWSNEKKDTVSQREEKLINVYLDITGQVSILQQRNLSKTLENDLADLKCSFCGKLSTSASLHKVHLRVHTGEKPFQCQYCEKRFIRKTSCTEHERTHTGEKPHSCKVCDKSFSQSGTLIRHQAGCVRISCGICPKKFVNNKKQLRKRIAHIDHHSRYSGALSLV